MVVWRQVGRGSSCRLTALLLALLLTACDGSRNLLPDPQPIPEDPVGGEPDPEPDGRIDDESLVFDDLDAELADLRALLADDTAPLTPDPANLAGLLQRPEDAELLIEQAAFDAISNDHALAAEAEDPDPDWFFTDSRILEVAGSGVAAAEIGAQSLSDQDAPFPDGLEASAGFRLVEPGATYVIDYERLDAEGDPIGPLRMSDRDRVRIELRLQLDGDEVITPDAAAQSAIVDWHPTLPQRLILRVPDNVTFGRIAFALRPDLPDPGQQVLAQRWSSVFSAEIWNPRPAANTPDPETIVFPLDAELAGADAIAFPDTLIAERLQHFLTEEQTPVLPMVIEGSDLDIGDLIAYVLPEGLPYAGRVVEVHDDAVSGQRLLLLEPDLITVFRWPEAGPNLFVEAGLMPDTVALRLGEVLPAADADATSTTGGKPRLDTRLRAQQIAGLFEVECAAGVPSILLSPSISVIPFSASITLTVQATGAEIECTFTALSATNNKTLQRLVSFAKGPAANVIKAVLGTNVEVSPLGELELNLQNPDTTRFGVEMGAGTDSGFSFKPILPGLATGAGFSGLEGTTVTATGDLVGQAGVKLDVSVIDLKSGFLGKLITFFAGSDTNIELGAKAKAGAAAGVGVKAANGAAVHQNKASTEAVLKAGLFAEVELTDLFNDILRYLLGSRQDLKARLDLDLFRLKVQPGFVISNVQDDFNGRGSFAIQREAGFLSSLIPGTPSGQLSLATSTVFNDFNDDVSYTVSECATRPGGRIRSPVIGCSLGFFCNSVIDPNLMMEDDPRLRVTFCPDPEEGPDDEDPPPPEDPPAGPSVAVDDEYQGSKNRTLNIGPGAGLRANDTVLIGDVATLVFPPTAGMVTVFDNGEFAYTPPADFTGAATFTYRLEGVDPVTSMLRQSNTADVTLTIANEAPVATDRSFELSEGSLELTVAAPGVLSNDFDPNDDALSAVLIQAPAVGTLMLAADGGFSYEAPEGFTGSVSFQYQADDGDLLDNRSNTATVTIFGPAPRVTCGDDGTRCPFDDVSFFLFAPCPGDFGGGNLICDGALSAVTLGSLPPAQRDSVVRLELPGLDPGIHVFEFDLLLPQPVGNDRTVILPSIESTPVFITLPNGQIQIVQPGNAAPDILDSTGNPRLEDGSSVQFGVTGQSLTDLTVDDVSGIDGGAADQTLIQDIAGLDSTLFIPQGFDEYSVTVYVSDDGELQAAENPRARGFVIIGETSALTPTNGGFEAPLLPPELRPIIDAAGGLNPAQPIVVTQTNTHFPVAGFFPDGGLQPNMLTAQTAGPEVAVRAGVALSVPPDGLTPPPAACDARPSNVRCSAGANETLLSTNSNGTVTRFNAIDGSAEGFFLGESAPNFVVSSGWLATQGPDNCIVVSDSSNGLWLYDTNGSVIRADGAGNTDPAVLKPLIESLDVGVRGFTFHPSNAASTTWLFAAVGSQIVRYDYGVDSNPVLDNRTVIVDAAGAEFNDLVIIDDLLYVTDQAPDSTAAGEPQDLVRVYSLDGADLGLLLDGLVTPYQIIETPDERIGVVNFGTGEILFTNPAGDDLRRYLLDDGDEVSRDNPRGLATQRDGNFLISGREGIGIATLDRHSGAMTEHRPASTERFIGNACLP